MRWRFVDRAREEDMVVRDKASCTWVVVMNRTRSGIFELEARYCLLLFGLSMEVDHERPSVVAMARLDGERTLVATATAIRGVVRGVDSRGDHEHTCQCIRQIGTQ